MEWWEPSKWLLGIRLKSAPLQESIQPLLWSIAIGFGIGLVSVSLWHWQGPVEFSFSIVLFTGGTFALLLLVLRFFELLLPSAIQISRKSVKRAPISGNTTTFGFDELSAFSITAIPNPSPGKFRYLSISLKAGGAIIFVVPQRITDNQIREVFSDLLAEQNSTNDYA